MSPTAYCQYAYVAQRYVRPDPTGAFRNLLARS